jgi:hypothetical protein
MCSKISFTRRSMETFSHEKYWMGGRGGVGGEVWGCFQDIVFTTKK